MKKIDKIQKAIKRKVNENRLRRSVQSILEASIDTEFLNHIHENVRLTIEENKSGMPDNVLQKFVMPELDVRKTHGDKRIENPATGNAIKLRTALKAKKGTAVYQQARQIYNSLKDKPANEQVATQLKELKELLDMKERAYASTDGKPYFDYDPGQDKLKVDELTMKGKYAGNKVKTAPAGKKLTMNGKAYTSLGKGKWKGPDGKKISWIEVSSMASALGNKEVVMKYRLRLVLMT